MLGNRLLNNARPIIWTCALCILGSAGAGIYILCATEEPNSTDTIINFFIIAPLALSFIIALQLLILRMHNR